VRRSRRRFHRHRLGDAPRIGERVRAYQAPVPTTEWVTETGHRAIRYLIQGERYRMSKMECDSQEKLHDARFVWNWVKYKLGITRSNYT
jgi:hypothetical protein